MSIPNITNEVAPKRVFVAEFLCGGGMFDTPVDAIPSSLLSEGKLMWRCLVEDFTKWTKVRTPLDPRLGLEHEITARIEGVTMQPCTAPWAQWIDAARDCDACLVIIPESDGLLTKGIAMMRASGIEVLAPTGNAIRVAADKWATAKWLHQAGISHPDTWSLKRLRCGGDDRAYTCSQMPTTGRGNPVLSQSPDCGYLVKPRDGCGTLNIVRYDELEPALASMSLFEITQQWLSGQPASVIVIGNHTTGRSVMLPAVWQLMDERPHCHRDSGDASHAGDISSTGDVIYRGGYGPIPAEMQTRAHTLVERVMQAMPGKPSGFIGIDLILGSDANHDAVIEVNPRLTSSYAGLRQMTDENLTQRLFGSATHSPVICVPTESIAWKVS